jgi:prepilin-type N-terminal cleavage/methylation domain-containing protein
MRIGRPSGFSLIELMVAMVVTLIVTGAIYGLLTGGQNAFRREPELSDRQQNIRAAMDLIMRDIASAGSGMPPFMQTFTTNLDGDTGLGACTDDSGAGVPCPMGSSGKKADELEIMANPNASLPQALCSYPGANSSAADLVASLSNMKAGSVVFVLMSDGTWTMANITATSPNGNNSGADNCLAGNNHFHFGFNSGNADKTGLNSAGGLCGKNNSGADWIKDANGNCVGCTDVVGTSCCMTTPCNPTQIITGEMIRYRIRYDSAGVPNLERFSSALADNLAGGKPVFQVIARGIDDLQVEYTPACDPAAVPPIPCVEQDNAPVVDRATPDYGTLTQSVKVTLSARSEAQNVAGEQLPAANAVAAGQRAALRGQLTSTGSPRAALTQLSVLPPLRQPGSKGPVWN